MNKILFIALSTILTILLLSPNAAEIGPVLIEVFGYRISTNTLFLSAAFISVFLILRIFIAIPKAYNHYYHKLFSKDAFTLLANFMLSVCANQEKISQGLFSKIEKLAPNPALLCLLKIQAFSNHSSTSLQQILEEGLHYPEITPLALKRLIDVYITQEQWHKANATAEQLWLLRRDHWLLSKKLYILFKLEAWEELSILSEKAAKAKLLSKSVTNELKAISLYKMAQSTTSTESLNLLDNACNLCPAFIHPHLSLLEMEFAAGNYTSFIKNATRAWSTIPHRALTLLILKLSKPLSADEFLEVCRTITKSNRDNYESLLLMAEALVAADKCEQADNLLQQALLAPHEQRVYILLAKCHHKLRTSGTQVYGWLDQATAIYSTQPPLDPYPEAVMSLLHDAKRKPLEQ